MRSPSSPPVIPPTARETEPLSSWSRRVASCQGTGPPRSRRTTASTAQGSRAIRPIRTSALPAPITYSLYMTVWKLTSPLNGSSRATPRTEASVTLPGRSVRR